MQSHESAHGCYPPDACDQYFHGIWVRMSPYLEQGVLAQQYHFDERADSAYHVELTTRIPLAVFLCPSCATTHNCHEPRKTVWTTHYHGNTGPIGVNAATGAAYPDETTGVYDVASEGVFTFPHGVTVQEIADGTSATIAFGEIAWDTHLGEDSDAVIPSEAKNLLGCRELRFAPDDLEGKSSAIEPCFPARLE
ncbi:MAG: DUF1559 domain-containing protein [Pirellulales bacterium]|nr:DUF1559 domain-containing protein [Pirellulales bacterium]